MTGNPLCAGLAGLALLLPVAACGQAREPARPSARQPAASAASKGAGLSLGEVTRRRERRLLSADTDGDGKVSRDEFVASARSGKGDPGRRFARWDANGDGSVDRQEIGAMMARRFNRLDTDRDGVLTPAERMGAERMRTGATNDGDDAPS